MTSVEIASSLCRQFEGLRLSPYLCPAGVPTIGYGSTMYADGRRVTQLDRAITKDEAEAILTADLAKRLPQVQKLCPGADTPGRLGALLDFAYNCGVGALEGSTLRKRVNAGQWDQVPAELRKWVRGGGKVLPGLVKRREAEIAAMESAC